MVSRCFTWVPIRWFRRTQYITSVGLFYKNWESCGGCLTVKNLWAHMQKYGFEENLTNYCKT